MITTILWDVGGVLAKTNFRKVFRSFAIAAHLSPDWVEAKREELLPEMVLGHVTGKEFLRDVIGARSIPHPNELLGSIALRYTKINRALLDRIDSWRGEYVQAVFSNVTELRVVRDKKIGLYDHFDKVYLSCVVGSKKPYRPFFHHALADLGVTSEETLLIDDKLRNIEAAKSYGLSAVLYKNSNEELLRELEVRGVT